MAPLELNHQAHSDMHFKRHRRDVLIKSRFNNPIANVYQLAIHIYCNVIERIGAVIISAFKQVIILPKITRHGHPGTDLPIYSYFRSKKE